MSYNYNLRRYPQTSLNTKLDHMIPLLEAIASSNTSTPIATPLVPRLQPIPAMATQPPIAFTTRPFDMGFTTQPLIANYALTSSSLSTPSPQHCFKRFKPSFDTCDAFENNRRNRFDFNSMRNRFDDNSVICNDILQRYNDQRFERPKNFFGYKGDEPLVVTPEDEATVEKLKADGAVPHIEGNLHGFKCSFCDKFLNSLTNAIKHFESPKHIRTRNLENLVGSDDIFVLKSNKIIDPIQASARNKEFNRLTKNQREEYCNQGIRLNDGIGRDAYFCVVCTFMMSSIRVVDEHLKDKIHLTNMAANKLGVSASEYSVVDVRIDKDPLKSLEEKLQNLKEPVIGLEHLIEYIDPNENVQRIYECKLCNTWDPVATVLTHLTGYPHRTNYIIKEMPNESHKFNKRTKESMDLCEDLAKQLEETNGRQKWIVNNEKPNVPQNEILANKFADSFETGINNKRRTAFKQKGINSLKQFISYFYSLRLRENCLIGDDNDVQNCVIIINTLTETLLKHRLKQFPEHIRGLVAHKLINKGIIDSFAKDYQINCDAFESNLNEGQQITNLFNKNDQQNCQTVDQLVNSEQTCEPQIHKTQVQNQVKQVRIHSIRVETKTREVDNQLLFSSNDTKDSVESTDRKMTQIETTLSDNQIAD